MKKLIEAVDEKCEKDTLKAFSVQVPEEEAARLDKFKKIQQTFQNEMCRDLREWFLVQLCQYRLVDKKKDIPVEVKELVFRELAGMFQFLVTPLPEEKTVEDKEADGNA